MPGLSPGGIFAGDFRIEKLVGRGGMGEVYKAVQLGLDRPVALKVIRSEHAAERDFRERFLRESTAATRIEHHNVIPVYAAGEADGVLFLAMRYVEGTDLGDLIKLRPGLEPERAVRIVEQVASALDEAHRLGLVHRDVKPANVLMAGRNLEHAYLTDFGLAKRDESVDRLTRPEQRLTGPGMFVGTADYAPPEQIEGRALDYRADVYTLGGVLFEAVAGRVPYPRDNPVATAFAHLTEPPPDLAQVAPGRAPPALAEVVKRAMSKDPEGRFLSAGGLGHAARAALSGAASTVPGRTVATGDAAPRRHRSAPRLEPEPPEAGPGRLPPQPPRPAPQPPRPAPEPPRPAAAPPPAAAAPRRAAPRPTRTLRAGLVLKALAGLAVMAATVLAVAAAVGGEDACGVATELRVLTSGDKQDAVQATARDYARAREEDGCRKVNLSVTSAPTATPVVRAFREDWGAASVGSVGPEPDVWLPQSSAEVQRAKQGRQDGARLRLLSEGSIAKTPLVLASTGRTARNSIRSADLEGLRRLRTVRTNPESSTAGLLATYALYEAAPDTDSARRDVERNVLIAGDDPREMLCQLRLTDRPWRQSAFLVPQNVLADFNGGRPLGGGCAAPRARAGRGETLDPIKLDPGDPTVFDHPCMLPTPRDAPADERKRREESVGFCRHLRGEAGQERLAEHGFTDSSGGGPPADLNPAALLDRWERGRRPARVLLAIDVSGSMKEPLPPTGSERRIDAAEAAARGALGLVGGADDDLGLWTFATRRRPIAALSALGPAVPSHRDQIEGALRNLQPPAGGTPLYDTIAAGVGRLRAGWRGDAVNGLVILTDGEDRNSVLGARSLRARLDAGDAARPVRVFVIASLGGRCRSVLELTPAFRGGCFEAATQGELDDAFRSVFASFGRGAPPDPGGE